ncbi:rifamycin-inactivating phosphotransferase [Lentzea flaviverrucosa]|uniref:Rifampicin phosphotransferase n=1 Tax=Lentzea flaviverrucosa TaxID=200379 RepID=A0A1H9XEZ4_9PSEU|nr:rifamycin-inactivating phosphotransferase [Lentzea flaviverrucosa]RDI21458.1 pyruvate,water dikinase [Lentzea flaviverrucosa]SES44788.1 pyruvate, water dikinase [Lentzea flaviverrucosa]
MGSYVLGFEEIGQAQVALCGGKGAHLGELSRIEGIRVPAGFCVTTEAFRRVVRDASSIGERLDRLARLGPDDREAIRARSAEIRQAIEEMIVPDDVATEIMGRLDDRTAYAVRSSATAEDLPWASFAGQQDTYLNVAGPDAVLRHVSRCWASLFTERAVIYRQRNGFHHREVHMAVVVQEMVFPHAAGVLFTADPATSDRTVSCVEASFGLGEALVSGRVNADVYRVRDGGVVTRAVAAKKLAIEAVPDGGTREQAIDPAQQEQPALTDAQVVRLAQLGRRIEAHFGRPQDIEWCLADGGFQFVQSRPITTLFPVPEAVDEQNRVYVSVGHQQMMTDAMRPLGLSVWQLTTPRPMAEAGGRLFVDVTGILTAPASRTAFLDVAGKSDPLMGDALRTVLERDGFLPPAPAGQAAPPIPGAEPATIDTDPDVVTELIGDAETSVAALKREIRAKSGVELLDFVLADFPELRRILFDARSNQVIVAGMQATRWLNEKLREWLGEKNAADTLTLSAPHNVTAEMGLELLDVADVIRPHPEVVAFLQEVQGDDFLDEMAGLDGGPQARDAIRHYLGKYGMRCVGEIDITRPRWSEYPSTLLPLILTNVANFEQGAGERRFEQGRKTAEDKEEELLERLRALPGGDGKAGETKRMIDRVRTFAGYREYPKYFMISRYFVYKQALLEEAERLAGTGVLADREDIFFLTLRELRDVIRTNEADDELIRRRRDDFRSYQALTPPRVLTSDGETITGSYRRDDLPDGALVGLPVSSGTVEGRARVVLDMAEAEIEPGDILVTAYTDPSWSPLFVAIAGLVTEVGGLMTHGAVVAREYGLPTVVGLEHATRLIQDGQRIRVNGTDGYVEILPTT